VSFFDPPAIGSTLDHYRIDALVAESGMATVFKATDLIANRKVALKIPHESVESDPILFERFKREEEIGARLNHPNVMHVYSDAHRSRIYMAMEWCDGRLLRSILSENPKLDRARALHITLGILDALDYIHKNGVVHRDLKPENIMVDPDSSIKLIDFGIASNVGAKRLTYAGFTQAIGTPDYISPEQVKGRRGDARSDLYATGIMLYEMLSGKKPFSGPTPMAIMNDRMLNHPLPPSEADPTIDAHLQEILYRALERDPIKRYASAHEFARDLRNPLAAVPNPSRSELKDWRKRKSATARKALLYILLAVIPFALFLVMFYLAHHQ
jgi:serine/threonine protein kinase